MLQEKPCKHPIHPMKKRKRKAFLHLVFAPSPPPTEKKAQVFKTIYRRMYKRDGIFFSFFLLFVTTWREKIDKVSANAFSHSSRPAELLAARSVPPTKRTEGKINADV